MKRMLIACVVVSLSATVAAQRERVTPQDGPHGPGTARVEPSQDVATREILAQKIAGEVRARIAVEANVTTGAPYSAEAVTESTQTLADGNRISRKSMTRVYRDGEGRTRREELDDTGTVISVSIVDPVAHVSYVLRPASRTAYRDPIRMVVPDGARGRGGMMPRSPDAPGAPAPEAEARMKATAEELARAKAASPIPPPPPPAPRPEDKIAIERSAAGATVREELGNQTIEGVSAVGSRSTTTIPAGAIGNLQPIKVVSEQWRSPDLQVLVMTKHTDPRTGETIYRLQGIVRAEPDRSLFTVPADYTMKESGIREPLR
jgi:hypothetical protein